MSNFTGHATTGLIVSSIGAVGLYCMRGVWGLDNMDIALPAISMFVMSLFPDIDIKSTPSKIFYMFTMIGLIVCYYYKQYQTGTMLAIVTTIPQLVSHRGIFHSPITAMILPSVVFYFHYIGSIDLKLAILVYIGSVVGYFTHLILDHF